ncbi:MAG TPA: cupin domain-containing protein [Thermoleophilaceae bacterium]|nr:cupin domain-containing protein [Thermoleophilaceae bacterium]
MPREGQELGSDAFRLRFVQLDDDVLVMEASYGGDGQLPPEHLHPQQDERFEVVEGAVRAIVDGAERRYERGDSFDVPAGTPHQMTGDGPARVHWEVRPALRTAAFFEQLLTGQAGPDFLSEFRDEMRLT